jgi:hypothetical protein
MCVVVTSTSMVCTGTTVRQYGALAYAYLWIYRPPTLLGYPLLACTCLQSLDVGTRQSMLLVVAARPETRLRMQMRWAPATPPRARPALPSQSSPEATSMHLARGSIYATSNDTQTMTGLSFPVRSSERCSVPLSRRERKAHPACCSTRPHPAQTNGARMN